MKKKFSVYLHASAGQLVDVEVDIPEDASIMQTAELAYRKASEIASLSECQIEDWNTDYEVDGEGFTFNTWHGGTR